MAAQSVKIRLKAVRTKAGLSLSQTAELTEVSKAMLGQIERGESSPTIATLWKLAKGFHLPLSAFIEDMGPTIGALSPARRSAVKFEDSIEVRTLFAFDPLFGTETFIITLSPGQTHASDPHDSGIIEDVFVISGRIEILQGSHVKVMAAGDGLRFKADQPHGYRNIGASPAILHNTMHYQKAGLLE